MSNHSRPFLAMGTTNLWRVYVWNTSRTDEPVDSVTSVTAEIYSPLGVLVTDSDITLTVDPNDPHIYWGEFPNTLTLIEGTIYTIRTTAVTVVNGETKTTSLRTPQVAKWDEGL